MWDKNFVYNLGISGDTTTEVLGRLDFEAKQRIDSDDENVCVFAVGLNDSIFLIDRGIFQTELDKFSENIQQISIHAGTFSSQVIFIGLTPVDERKTNPISWAPNKVYKNQSIEAYNHALKSFCDESRLPFIDVLSQWRKEEYIGWLYDGVHPNAQGHDKLFEQIAPFLT